MVIISNKSGQLANHIRVFAHFIANAIECGYEVWNPSFFDYAQYFVGTYAAFVSRYPPDTNSLSGNWRARGAIFRVVDFLSRPGRLARYKRLWVHVLEVEHMRDTTGTTYDLSGAEFLQRRTAGRVLFVRGFAFRDFGNYAKHAVYLRQFFAPVALYAKNVAILMTRARQDCDVLVGIHIRQGDYLYWRGGKYFYDSNIYLRLARQALELWPTQRVKFLICSNVQPDLFLFKGLEYVLGTHHLIEDLYAFAQCDYLIGPPSTYTEWASFYGSVPLCQVESADASLNVNDFVIIEGAA